MAAKWDDESATIMPRPPRSNEMKRGRLRKETHLTKGKFEEYLKGRPEDALMQLTRINGGLENFLKNQTINIDILSTALRCFDHACAAELATEEKNHLLCLILDTPFLSVTLMSFLRKANALTSEVIDHVLNLMLTLVEKFSDKCLNTLLILFPELDNRIFSEEAVEKLSTLKRIVQGLQSQGEESQSHHRYVDNDDEAPPEDFRILPPFPRQCDLAVNEQPFLRMNKINQCYESHDQYLDIQFRLLREDLIAPLRESLSKFQSHGGKAESKMLSSLNAYSNVRLIRPICRLDGLGYRISFDIGQMASVNWERSKRLIYGSLLCLSSDNFKTCIYATVVGNDKMQTKNGLLDVCFQFSEVCELNEFVHANRKTRFVMVESPAYYEAYKHVLLAIQTMGVGNFAFDKYIIKCDKDVLIPHYLRKQDLKYDLRPVVDSSFKINDDKEQEYHCEDERLGRLSAVNILKDEEWPTSEELNLNQSQSIALRHALTREFAIIQGPPGTGKTHLGLNILKILLHNKHLWQDPVSPTPIVVICYTNHALDEFLLQTLSFFQGKMVRVGARSQVDSIKDYSINNHRLRSRQNRETSQAVHASRYNMKVELENLKTEIDQTATKLEIAQREIIHELCLEEEFAIDKKHLAQLGKTWDDSLLSKFLGINKELQKIESITKIAPVSVQRDVDENNSDSEYEDEYGDDDDEEILDGYTEENHRFLDDEDTYDLAYELGVIKAKAMAFDVSSLTSVEKEDKRQRFKRQKLQCKIWDDISKVDCMSKEEASNVENIWELTKHQRWRLYRYWVQGFIHSIKGTLEDKEFDYETKVRRYQDILRMEDRDIIQDATIVGLTTTGAAKYQSILAQIGPKIIIFEEAAEVLEAHVVVNLCKKCEHAIFIGDHKQLRPKPTVHTLAKKFKLDISLFERLIRNNVPYIELEAQHRMRPEISEFMRLIYPKLIDHDSVKHYPDVSGIRSNIFFICHNKPEQIDNETKSRINTFEGKYLKALCKNLKKQGYRNKQITIMTTYSEQQHYISMIMNKDKYKNLRIVTVDSYQGKENDLVLLSLVRSSKEDGIGFLAEDNRLCVAFSRAKIGFYVIGNFEHLQKYSSLLREMVKLAHRNQCISEGLPFGCTVHDTQSCATTPEQLSSLKELCKKPLKCGHQCERLCHTDDPNHELSMCIKPCVKFCSAGHSCKKKCYEDCGVCMESVTKKIPSCGHHVEAPCFEEPWKVKCTAPATRTLPCGHTNQGVCSRVLNKCFELVEVQRDKCGHICKVECHQKDTDICKSKCTTELQCGHMCKGTCGECNEGRLHIQCKESCGRVLICSHNCLASCSFCPPCDQPCINKCKHNSCQNKCGEPCTPCNEGCRWKCKHSICTKRCSQICDRERCDEPCKKLLRCGHPCIGICGELCPKLCRECDRKALEDQHIWGFEDINTSRYIQLEDCIHTFEVDGLDRHMNDKPSEDSSIDMKQCPLCKTVIMTTARYGNEIKRSFDHIQQVKKKIVGCDKRIERLKGSIERKRGISAELRTFVQEIFQDKNDIESEGKLAAVTTQINFYQALLLMRKDIAKCEKQLQLRKHLSPVANEQLEHFEKWLRIKRVVFSEQETLDAKIEYKRLGSLVKLTIGRARADAKSDGIPSVLMTGLENAIHQLENNENTTALDVNSMLESLREYIPESTLGISEEEKLEIVAAIGGRKGQWYQCQNGHYYSIGDCGRAYETAKCPECESVIGGKDHELHPGNVEAPEIDGAEGPLHDIDSDYLYALQLQFGDD